MKIKKGIIQKISYKKSIGWGICKVILAALFRSVLFSISGFYHIAIGVARRENVKKNRKTDFESYIFISLVTIIASIIYVIYSLYGYFNGLNANYHMYIAIGIATVSFTDLTLAVIGVVKTRKRNDMQTRIDKLINLVTSLISLSLTQMAILSFTTNSDMSIYNGTGGMIMGGLASIIGIYMLIYVIKNKNSILNKKGEL